MSQNNNNLPTSKKDADRYVSGLRKNKLIKEVYIKGSRSPLSKKVSRYDSDWDIEIIVDERIVIANPRRNGWLHADVHQSKEPSALSVLYSKIK